MTLDRNARAREILAKRLRHAGHPARLALLAALGREPGACVCELARQVGLDQPTTSHHLSVLRHAGMVSAHREGPRVAYRRVEAVTNAVLTAMTALLLPPSGRSEDEA
jgi:ArsR family transcriptional regulator